MGIFGDAINYIIGLGASVMLPLVIAVLSIIVGVKVGKGNPCRTDGRSRICRTGTHCRHDECQPGACGKGHVRDVWASHERCRRGVAGDVTDHMGIRHRNRCDPR